MFLAKNVTVYPITSDPIAQGAVAWEDGKIIAVGALGAQGASALGPQVEAALSAGRVEVVDGQGGVLIPGIIDAHSHLGIHEQGLGWEGADYNETTSSVTPDMRAIDGINPHETGVQDALHGGVTAVCVVPGSANVIGGAISLTRCLLQTEWV